MHTVTLDSSTMVIGHMQLPSFGATYTCTCWTVTTCRAGSNILC